MTTAYEQEQLRTGQGACVGIGEVGDCLVVGLFTKVDETELEEGFFLEDWGGGKGKDELVSGFSLLIPIKLKQQCSDPKPQRRVPSRSMLPASRPAGQRSQHV